jgi:hypothetical protein
MEQNPKKAIGDIAVSLRKELQGWKYHQEVFGGVCRMMFLKGRALVSVVVDLEEDSIAVDAFCRDGSTHEKFQGINNESIKKSVDAAVGKTTFIEEMKKL